MFSSKLLGDRYQVVEVLSQGAFCQTYKAQDTYFPSYPYRVVKHFLPSSKYSIPLEIRRRLFTREVEALKKLSNYDLVPNLLSSFEENLEFYLVQEFIEGHPLSAELAPGKCWTETQVFQLLYEILTILNFVHSHGLIHRDVKPHNIIRRQQDNRLVLIDFGAVKPIWNHLIRGQDQTAIITPIEQYTTIAIGTPGYMPNEQQRGKPRLNSDIYALGMIGIQALTGIHPTQLSEDSHTGEIIWQQSAQVSHGLAAVLNKMVRYHFQDRYKSAKEALNALLALNNFHNLQQDSGNIKFQESKPLAENEANQFFQVQELASLAKESKNITLADTLLPSTKISEQSEDSQDASLLPNHYISQTNNSTIAAPQKPALLIGLAVGVFSGLVLMIVSYWSVQIVAPTPQIQDLRLQMPQESP
ncbi:serine/threonine protein kinase [Calothrix sp. FACHB-1219]|uniref:serine/threonine-protein kinase n=1 Tax=unclassified Calothrix TaxID=2619626 RepID=UPI00168711A1|nr:MULTISPECIES: serine/threonine-protein kinase [unclassified Calothrix]MBD2206533.1 serine/threonine protein kinase [Calothrix sp. FACHB-168]MBD2221329.1 serine/threonine protein kinase [Calothrix sp. FACHB-1219]